MAFNIAVLVGSAILGKAIIPDDGVGDVLSGAAKFVKSHAKDGKGAGDPQNAILTQQISRLREELHSVSYPREVTVVTDTSRSGPGAFTITLVVAAGAIGYAYIKWKGWKLSDMIWVTKGGLSDACSVVGNQLNQVSDSVLVTKKHLAGRIDRVDANLDETHDIIAGTRDEVGVIHLELSTFQKELKEVYCTVEELGSKLGCIEDTQDCTGRAIDGLVGFVDQMKHNQSANIRQISSFAPPAIESSSEQIVRKATSLPLPPVAESSASQESRGSSNEARTSTPKASIASSSRWLSGLGFLRSSAG